MTHRGSAIWSYTLRRHLVDECAGDDHHVRLARTRTKHDAEAVEIVACSSGMHHFHGAARESERHGPQRSRAGPIDELVDGGHFETAYARRIHGHGL
jgi:hypothetical protein